MKGSTAYDEQQLAQQAEELARQIKDQGLDAAYTSLEEAFAEFTARTGEGPEALSAPGATPLSFHAPGAARARDYLRKNICEGPPAVRTAIQAAMPSGAGAVVHAVIVALALPGAAVIVAPIVAGVVMAVGLEEACRRMAAETRSEK